MVGWVESKGRNLNQDAWGYISQLMNKSKDDYIWFYLSSLHETLLVKLPYIILFDLIEYMDIKNNNESDKHRISFTKFKKYCLQV